MSNIVECKIAIDTSKLMVSKIYKREVLLHSNSSLETHSVIIIVRTAAVPVVNKDLPYLRLALLIGLYFSLGWFVNIVGAAAITFVGSWVVFGTRAVFESLTMAAAVVGRFATAGAAFMAIFVTTIPIVVGALAGFIAGFALGGVGSVPGAILGCIVGLVFAGLIWFMAGAIAVVFGAVVVAVAVVFGVLLKYFAVVEAIAEKGFNRGFAFGISLIIIGLGTSLGIGCRLGFLNPFIVSSSFGISPIISGNDSLSIFPESATHC